MCKKTICFIEVGKGANFVLALCAHGFAFVPQNAAAQKILSDENENLEQVLKSGQQPRVFGLDFSKIAGNIPQGTPVSEGTVQMLSEVQVHHRKAEE